MSMKKQMSQKLLVICFMAIICLSSCLSFKQIGELNVISTRNVDNSKEYTLMRNYMGGTKKELRKSRAKDLKEAVSNVVKQTPGGEFLANAKVYMVKGKYFAVEGDVWGLNENANFRGFKVGDKVQWRGRKYVITELKNDKVCTIKDLETEEIKEANYQNLKKDE